MTMVKTTSTFNNTGSVFIQNSKKVTDNKVNNISYDFTPNSTIYIKGKT